MICDPRIAHRHRAFARALYPTFLGPGYMSTVYFFWFFCYVVTSVAIYSAISMAMGDGDDGNLQFVSLFGFSGRWGAFFNIFV